MKNPKIYLIGLMLLAIAGATQAQEKPESASPAQFDKAAESINRKLEKSVEALNQLRERVAEEKIPLSRKLDSLEGELAKIRLEYQQASRLLDSRALDLANFQSEIKARHEEASYLSNLLGEYSRNFESRLHIAELQRYREVMESAKLAQQNSGLTQEDVYAAQLALLSAAVDRLNGAIGGERFEGTAVDASGSVKSGTFVLAGPAALFRSQDGQAIGTAEQRLGSLEPAVIAFNNPADIEAAEQLFTQSSGQFPLDPTLGNAHKIERTQETLIEHIKKGGPVMIPIFLLAGVALLVAVFKWFGMFFIPAPSRKRIRLMLDAVARLDKKGAVQEARAMRGPVGKMLLAGVEHLEQPRELIEEVMYEYVLATRLKLQRFLPFIAVSAASAPLLGLLGTVTGIINTFKLITVFGTGDVKTLSGGISEALITTEYGLIVAIPSLLIHALLTRKAQGVINNMEKAAVALVNQVGKTPPSIGMLPENKKPSGPEPAPAQKYDATSSVQPMVS